MNTKRIIMFVAAGIVSFGGSFVFVWLKSKAVDSAHALEQTQAAESTAPEELPGLFQVTAGASAPSKQDLQKAVSEKQLKALICEIQEKTQEYETKTRSLAAREQRVQRAARMLKRDIEDMNKLRVELASAAKQLKDKQAALERTRVQIKEGEKANIRLIASTFDQMEPASAGSIAVNMCDNNQADDAVKIIYYMTQRTAAELLAELTATRPELAATLCNRLKRVKQE